MPYFDKDNVAAILREMRTKLEQILTLAGGLEIRLNQLERALDKAGEGE